MSFDRDPRRMVGDPDIPWDRVAQRAARGDRDANRAACLYGAAMLRKVGRLPTDLAAVDVLFKPPATILFISADERQVELGRYVIPDRVLTYDPRPIALPPMETAE